MTDAELQKLWGWCGFRQNTDLHRDYHYEYTKKVGNWHQPDSLVTYDPMRQQKGNLPPPDLNTLFRWAVLKLSHHGIHFIPTPSGWECQIDIPHEDRYGTEYCAVAVGRGVTTEDALAQAILRVVEEEKHD